jgi:FkbM family methyltransferase
MWLGSYEAEKQVALADALRAGQVFFDIGANTGFFSLLGARCVGPSGTVVAVEPLPRNVDFINRHCALNGVHNILVVPKAVADFEGSARFLEDGLSTSHLSLDGTMSVEVITLDRLAKELNLTPDVMKIDVEGAEAALLLGARHLLRTARPLVFLAVHTEDLYHEILEILPTVGYVATPLLPAAARTEFLGEIVLTPQ